MKSTSLLWGAFILLSGVVTASNYYIYNELKRFDAKNIASNATNEAVKSPAILSESDVITIFDERQSSIQRRKAKVRLSHLQTKYQLAQADGPDNRLIYGKSNARITLQEFGDLECPYCRKMHADLKRVVDHSEGIINWEYKHFPLGSHNPAAAIEAQAIECIKETYGNRIAWIAIDQFVTVTEGNGKGINDMISLLRSFGLNGSLINNCLASNDHKDIINNDYEAGRKTGISATPAIVIVDKKTGKEYLLKGYKTSEMLLKAIGQIVNP